MSGRHHAVQECSGQRGSKPIETLLASAETGNQPARLAVRMAGGQLAVFTLGASLHLLHLSGISIGEHPQRHSDCLCSAPERLTVGMGGQPLSPYGREVCVTLSL